MTGRAAHGRVARLFQTLLLHADDDERQQTTRWIDTSPYAVQPSTTTNDDTTSIISFLWENAPRYETKSIRDTVQVYSHLPNGIHLLDDKWALARLLMTTTTNNNTDNNNNDDDELLATTLESHCFRGEEFVTFAKRVGLLVALSSSDATTKNNNNHEEANGSNSNNNNNNGDDDDDDDDDDENNSVEEQYQFQDLITTTTQSSALSSASANDKHHHHHPLPPPPPKNLWVIKDAMSNGAGGIWIVDPLNAHEFLPTTTNNNNNNNNNNNILHPNHRYIAQQYAWPPTLYNQRKCHVRVYALLTSDGRGYVHKRAFLHVANEVFEYNNNNDTYSDDTSGGGGGETQGDEENDNVGGNNQGRKRRRRRLRFEPAVHITNCCANSHDIDKFAGEICVELDKPGPFSSATPTPLSNNTDSSSSASSGNDGDFLPLGDYFPSIAASVAAVVEKSAAYVQGGQANNGFEYLGLDFVLSSVPEEKEMEDDDGHQPRRKPVAYLLEVNAPPSQDTATGLPHAEELHDEVISDLLRLWVLPNLGIPSTSEENGWKCVYSPPPPPPPSLDEESSLDVEKANNLIVPSKASILNKIRWAMFEKRASKEYESSWRKEDADSSSSIVDKIICEGDDAKNHKCESDKEDSVFDADSFVSFVRSQFPYFSDSAITSLSSSSESPSLSGRSIFLESGGGAQVPRVVVNAMSASLMNRDRSVVGATYLSEARKSIASLLVESYSDDDKEEQDADEEQTVIMGANATSLIEMLAGMYCENGILTRDDEIVIATENHLANVLPWIKAAESVGAKIKWWTVTKCQQHQINEAMESSNVLSDLVNERTRIVAVSHASNILGCVRDISSICTLVHQVTGNQGHVVVDGVAASPHLLSLGSGTVPNWYVVSLHKLFGPHLSCLIGKRSTALQIANVEGNLSNEKLCKTFETGTMNYEACAGAVALNEYFHRLGIEAWKRYYGDVGIFKGRHIHSYDQKPRIISTQASGDQVEERSSSLSNSVRLSIARTCIIRVESRLLGLILGYFRISRVYIIEDVGDMKVTHDGDCIPYTDNEQRIPIVSFVHETIPSSEIVEHCRNHGVVCRSCKFLSTDKLWDEMNLTQYDCAVRFSLAHYNSTTDISKTIDVLEMLDKW